MKQILGLNGVVVSEVSLVEYGDVDDSARFGVKRMALSSLFRSA